MDHVGRDLLVLKQPLHEEGVPAAAPHGGAERSSAHSREEFTGPVAQRSAELSRPLAATFPSRSPRRPKGPAAHLAKEATGSTPTATLSLAAHTWRQQRRKAMMGQGWGQQAGAVLPRRLQPQGPESAARHPRTSGHHQQRPGGQWPSVRQHSLVPDSLAPSRACKSSSSSHLCPGSLGAHQPAVLRQRLEGQHPGARHPVEHVLVPGLPGESRCDISFRAIEKGRGCPNCLERTAAHAHAGDAI